MSDKCPKCGAEETYLRWYDEDFYFNAQHQYECKSADCFDFDGKAFFHQSKECKERAEAKSDE